MILPIGDENVKGGYKPIFSYTFIVINILIFIFQITLQPEALRGFLYNFGAVPSDVISGVGYMSLFTNMFLHGGLFHIGGNMLYLWIFGDNIEAVIGNSRFVLFYLSGGLLATIAHIAFNPTSSIPAVGASGAIAAVMGAYFVLFPKSRIKMVFIVKVFYISAKFFLGLWIIQQIFSGIQDFGPASAATGGTAWWAHIGGFIYGAGIGFLIKKMGFMDGVYEKIERA